MLSFFFCTGGETRLQINFCRHKNFSQPAPRGFCCYKNITAAIRVHTKVMQITFSPTQLKSGHQGCHAFYVVPRAGLEPARCNQPRILSPLCLPFHHPGIVMYMGVGHKV